MTEERGSLPLGLSVRDVLAALPAVTALSVGALYGLGVLLNVTQLLDADVSVGDALPLIPLQDHLTEGLAAVFTSVRVFAIAVVAFVVVLTAYSTARSLDLHAEIRKASADAAIAIRDSLEDHPASAALAALDKTVSANETELDELRELLEQEKQARGPHGNPSDELVRRVSEMDKKVAAAQKQRDDSAEEFRRMKNLLQAANRHVDRFHASHAAIRKYEAWANRMPTLMPRIARWLGLFFLAAAPFATPVVAVVSAVEGAILLLYPKILLRPRQMFPLVCVSVLLPWGINAYANPQPLPRATVVTDRNTTQGSLITSSNSRYVVTSESGAFVSIPASRVRSVTVQELERPRPKRVITQAIDWIKRRTK